MKKLFQICMLLVFLNNFALAEQTSIRSISTKNRITTVKQLVDQFYQNSRINLFSHFEEHQSDCDNSQLPSCVNAACDKLGVWGCDSLDEVKKVGVACRGNHNGLCLKTACQKLGAWGCDSLDEITTVARACIGNHETDCFDSVCKRLGTWGCDSVDEITEVLKTCAGN